MDKSYVTMEQHQCPICLTTFDTGALLLDQRMRKVFDRNTVTGHGTCAECKKQLDDDRMALVEATNDTARSTIQNAEAKRTGNLGWIKRKAAAEIFNVPVIEHPMVFVEVGVLDKLKAMQEE